MVVHAYYPLAEPRVEREALAAQEAGFEVDVVALRATGEPAFEVVDGVNVHRLPMSHRRGAGLTRIMYEYLGFTVAAAAKVLRLSLRDRFDVVHIHAPPDFLIIAALVPRLRGARVVLDIHDPSPHIFESRFRSAVLASAARRALETIERVACAASHMVITVHEPYKRELVRSGVSEDRVTVVMNAVDERLLSDLRRDRSHVRDHQAFSLAYHGTITDWYGVELIVDAVSILRERIPGIRAIVLGEGDALPAVTERAVTAGVADRIYFSNRYLPIREALALVSEADCGVIPNHASLLNRFALSSKLFEYVALGLPVVVARLETLGEYFAPGEVTFFTPDDAESLADAILWVHDNPVAVAEKVEAAERRAVAYSWAENRTHLVQALRGGSRVSTSETRTDIAQSDGSSAY